MKKYSIGQFSKEIGVTPQTLRNWDKANKLNPSHTSPSGHRYYSQQQVNNYLNLNSSDDQNNLISNTENDVQILIGVLDIFSRKIDSRHKDKIEHLIRELEEIRIEEE